MIYITVKERGHSSLEKRDLRTQDPVGSSIQASGVLLQRPYPQWGYSNGNKLIFGVGTRLRVQPSK
jgi:hypothetical protein